MAYAKTGATGTTFAAVNAALGTANATIDINGQKITNAAEPTTDHDVATKYYVDNNGGGGAGDITSVTAGTGLAGGGTTGAVTLTLGTVTASKALVSDGSGYLAASATTATELGYVSGVTSAIQTQLNAKQTTTLTNGNFLVGNGSNAATSVTPTGDVTFDNTGAFAIGASKVTSSMIVDGTIVNADVNSSAAIAVSKLAAVTASKALASDSSGFVSATSVTSTELGYISGVTSAIQTQLNTKAATTYVDAAVEGLTWKTAVRAASTANVSVSSSPSSIDGVTLSANDRVLLKNQTAPAENGYYYFTSAGAALTRTNDGNAWAEIVGSVVYVEEGSTNAAGKYVNTNVNGGTLNTTAITFTTFSAPTAITGSGTSNYVTYWSGTNALAGEAALAASRGGLGTDGSGFTGVVKASSGTFSAATLVNADVSGSAAIAYSKLALTGAVLNADLAGSIADSKLSTISTGGKVSGAAITSGDISTSGLFTTSNTSGITASAGPVVSGDASHAGAFKAYDASNHLLTINPGTMSGANTYTWPTSTGTNAYVLSTNGSGTLSWVAQSGGGGAPGFDTTGSQTLTSGQSGYYFRSTTGSLQTYTLPTASAGYNYTVIVGNAAGAKVLAPGSVTITFNGVTSQTAGFATSTVVGDTLQIACDGTNWHVINSSGVWSLT